MEAKVSNEKPLRIAYIVGIEQSNPKVYRVIECSVTPTSDLKQHQTGRIWEYTPRRLEESAMIEYATSMHVANAKVEGGKLVGRHASLSRFDTARVVVMSIIKLGDTDKVAGYRVANTNGNITKIKEDELIEHCRKAESVGKVYIQNMIFSNDSNESSAHIRQYVNGQVPVEVLTTSKQKPKTSIIERRKMEKLAKNGYDINAKEHNKDLFNAEQKKVLIDAKQQGIDIRLIFNPKIKAECMRYYVAELKIGNDITPYLNPEYTVDQLSVLSVAAESGVDMSKLSNPNLSYNDMMELYERLDKQIWSVEYTGNIISAKIERA